MYYRVVLEPVEPTPMVQKVILEFSYPFDVGAVQHAEKFASMMNFEGGPDGLQVGKPIKLEAWNEPGADPRIVKEW
jgi:hypothetical protein